MIKSAMSNPEPIIPGGYCSESAGSSFSKLWRKVVIKQLGAAMVIRSSSAQSQSRDRAAARIACEAYARRVYFWTCEKVVQCAHAVPYAPHAKEITDQFQLFAHHIMRMRARGNGVSIR